MKKVNVNFKKTIGKIKPMHAVNNGPVNKFGEEQRISNLRDYKAAGIPYARNHDASFCSTYGINHTVDVDFIFTNFDADPYSPDSYDFACTDEYVRVTELSGAKTFYRLGSRIEHQIKKYNTLPPKDFKKWAIICEHIIKHYTEGWADGYHYDMEYWEIWNEPDLDADSEDKRTWGGTPEEFFKLYEISAKHLKEKFPHLKIGGPAISKDFEWVKRFLNYVKETNSPMDFFSWHLYAFNPNEYEEKSIYVRELLNSYGFENSESILNEWNYAKGWTDEEFLYTMRVIPTLKGAAFNSAVMCVSQNSPVDMLMYYDARPCGFNGLWAPHTYDRLKGYYSLYAFNILYKLGNCVETYSKCDNVYLCAAEKDTEKAILITHFDDDNDETIKSEIEISIDGVAEKEKIKYYILNNEYDLELIKEEKYSSKKLTVITLHNYETMLVVITK